MRKLLATLILAGTVLHLNAQKTVSATFFRLNSHFPLFEQRILMGFDEEQGNEVIGFSGFAPAVQFLHKNGLYEEIELSRLRWKRTDDADVAVEEVAFSIRYEAGFAGFKPRGRLRYRMGWSYRPYFAYRSIYTWNFSRYPTEQESYGIIWSLTGHVDWRLYKKLYFNLSPELLMLNAGFRIEEVFEDPNLDEGQSQSIDLYVQPLRILLRLGVGWRL